MGADLVLPLESPQLGPRCNADARQKSCFKQKYVPLKRVELRPESVEEVVGGDQAQVKNAMLNDTGCGQCRKEHSRNSHRVYEHVRIISFPYDGRVKLGE